MASYLTRECDCTASIVMGSKRPERCEHGNRFQTEAELNPPQRAPLRAVSPKRQAEEDAGTRPMDDGCHGAYDAGELDLLSRLVDRKYFPEMAHMVSAHELGFLTALQRVTGERWAPSTADDLLLPIHNERSKDAASR